MLVRNKPQWHRHDRRGSAVVLSLIAVAPRKIVKTADIRIGMAETLNIHVQNFCSVTTGWANLRGIAAAPSLPPWHRTRTAVAPPLPPCFRSTTAAQSRKSRLAPLRRSCGVSMAVLPPHWPHSAAANTAVMPPMIAVAPPSNRTCNSMRSPCPQRHRCGSAAPRRKTHE